MTTDLFNTPGRSGWARTAGGVALGVAAVLAGVRATFLDTGAGDFVEFAVGLVAGALVAALAWLVVRLTTAVLGALPGALVTGFVAAALVVWVFDTWSPAEILVTALDPDAWQWPLARPNGLSPWSLVVIVAAAGLIAGALYSWATGRPAGRKRLNITAAAVVTAVPAGAVVLGLASDGADPWPDEFSSLTDRYENLAGEPLPDPTTAGAFEVEVLTYGAGDNPKRPEFGNDRDLESRTVDASKLLPEWKGVKARMRERYWGFGLDAAPLNATVYAPVGNGEFPLALIVHGNHGMEDYSDGGYGYLGELLASRGIITVSVDQNYLNGSWSGDFRGKEMAARAWLLLEHLDLWRDWRGDPAHPLGARADLSRIALIGHSRGGEAVSIAYAFNDLPAFPDDGTLAFDYGFDIRALVAIAQVDQRYHRRVRIQDVNFLALQGSYDADEPAFHGLRQYHRTHFSGNDYRFKAALYVHGANHGQFNTTWGRHDFGAPGAWLLNTAPIIPADRQQRIAAAYISAFADVTLKGDGSYRALFRDPRVGAAWLPDVPYVQQFQDSTFRPLAIFDEDLDVATGTAEGARITAQEVDLWREDELLHRDQRPQGTSAVVLGWAAHGETPTFAIDVPETFWQGVGRDDYLTLSVTASTEELPEAADATEAADSNAADGSDGEDDGDTASPSPSFDIEAVFTDARVRAVSSDAVARLAPPFRVRYLKHEGDNDEQYNADWEPVLQYMELPLAALAGDDPVASIQTIRLRFGGMPEAVVIVDDIGIRRANDP